MSLHRRRPQKNERQGFALIVSLVLMALIVLLVASIGTVGRVQARLAETRQAQALARHQALYGLGLAIGQLQETAGHDQRVTARAEILGDGVAANPFWTGVWDYTGGGEPTTRWLVTEDHRTPEVLPEPIEALEEDTFETLVGSGTVSSADQEVVVPFIEFKESSMTSRVAWWTADEGVKASLTAVETPVVSDEVWRQANPALRWETLFDDVDQDDPSNAQRIEQLLTYGQLENDDLFEGEDSVFETHYHDLTFSHKGLLTNTLDGGLKLNIQDAEANPVERFEDVFGSGDVARVWSEWSDTLGVDEEGLPRLTLTPITVSGYEELPDGMPYVNVIPVLSEVTLYMAFFHHHTENRPTTRHYFDAEFTNPFRYGLLLEDSDFRAFTINATGLPAYSLTVVGTNSGEFGPYDLDVMAMSSGSAATSTWIEFDDEPEGNYSGSAQLLPGEVYRVRDRDPDESPQGLIKRTNETGMRINTAFSPSNDSIILEARFDDGENVSFSVYGGAAVGTEPIFVLTELPFDDFRYFFPSPLSAEYALGRNPDFGEGEQTVAFHAALGRDYDWESEASVDFLRQTDLRSPTFRNGLGTVRMGSTNPVDLQDNDTGLHQETELFADSEWRDSTYGSYTDMRLYDVPEGEPLTIGSYRLLPYKNLPPYALGGAFDSVDANVLNTAFDRYFLATPAVSQAADFENPRIEVLSNAPSSIDPLNQTVGQYLYLDGAFNWHSTSASAWKSSLHQVFSETHPIEYTDPLGQLREISVEPEKSAIFRHPFGAMNQVDLESDVSISGMRDDDRRRVYFQQGVRLLDEESLDDLSEAIVSEIQLHGVPFASLSGFLNDGLLDRAIEASGINAEFLPHANGFITQGDLAAMLSLAPAVRSDVFSIRVSSEIINPVTGEREGTIALEARLQRVPEFIDGSDSEAVPSSTESDAGRRFLINSFRWLDQSNAI